MKLSGYIVLALFMGFPMAKLTATNGPQHFREMSDTSIPSIAWVAANVLTNSIEGLSSTNLVFVKVDAGTTPPEELPQDFVGCMGVYFWVRNSISTNITSSEIQLNAQGYLVIVSPEGRTPEMAIFPSTKAYARYTLDGKWKAEGDQFDPSAEFLHHKNGKPQQAGAGYPPQGVGSPDP